VQASLAGHFPHFVTTLLAAFPPMAVIASVLGIATAFAAVLCLCVELIRGEGTLAPFAI
jgi:hypothetical protein